jgi:hypothetical protein
MSIMHPTPAEGFEFLNRIRARRMGLQALGRGTPLGRELGKNRRARTGGVTQVVVGRDLTWRPELIGIGYGWIQTEPGSSSGAVVGSGRGRRTYLYNTGGSPAVGARYVYRRGGSGWVMSAPVDVPAHGADAEVVGGRRIADTEARTLLGSVGAAEPLAGAIFCRDFLERRWCFPIPDLEHGVTLEAIVWRKGSRAPAWASSPGLWTPQPPRRRSIVSDPDSPRAG